MVQRGVFWPCWELAKLKISALLHLGLPHPSGQILPHRRSGTPERSRRALTACGHVCNITPACYGGNEGLTKQLLHRLYL